MTGFFRNLGSRRLDWFVEGREAHPRTRRRGSRRAHSHHPLLRRLRAGQPAEHRLALKRAAFSRALHRLDFFVPFVSRQKGHYARGMGRGVGLVREGRPDTRRRLQDPRGRIQAAGLQRGCVAADGGGASGGRVWDSGSGADSSWSVAERKRRSLGCSRWREHSSDGSVQPKYDCFHEARLIYVIDHIIRYSP